MAAFVHPRPRRARGLVTGIAVVAAVAAALSAAVALLLGGLPSLNPFSTQTVERSQPAVLHALDDVAQFRAAVATYSVVVDVERDTRFVPSFLKGERTVLTATGSVDATVDFGALDETAVAVGSGGDTVTVTLPEAVVGRPRLDLAGTRVVARDRGLLDRIGGVFADTPTGERSLQLAAERRMATAAAADGDLVDRAERNTRRMVESLLRPLGFSTVEVVFSPAPAPAAAAPASRTP